MELGAKFDKDKRYLAIVKVAYDKLWHAYYNNGNYTYDRVSAKTAMTISKHVVHGEPCESLLIHVT